MHQVCSGTCRMSDPEESYKQAQLKKEAALALEKELGDLENWGLTELARAKLREVSALWDEERKLMHEFFRQLGHQLMTRPGKQPMHARAFRSLCHTVWAICPARVGVADVLPVLVLIVVKRGCLRAQLVEEPLGLLPTRNSYAAFPHHCNARKHVCNSAAVGVAVVQ